MSPRLVEAEEYFIEGYCPICYQQGAMVKIVKGECPTHKKVYRRVCVPSIQVNRC